jgi:DNA polymerase II small subunit
MNKLIEKLKEKSITFLDTKTLYNLVYDKPSEGNSSIEVVKNYGGETSHSKPNDWINYFNDRFNRLRDILLKRVDANGVMSLEGIKNMPNGAEVKSIVMVAEVSISPVKHYQILEIEDNTSRYKAILSVVNDELLKDHVVMIKGKKYKDAIFVNDVVFPDVQIIDKDTLDIGDTYAVFLSDIHVGSKLFAATEFELFINWLNGGVDEYKSIAEKVKFLVVAGDLVDGVGVYPEQEKELEIKDVRSQYDALYQLLDRVPKHITILISQGNHDATHIAEPQPKLEPYFGESLYKLTNAVFLSNPYQVNLKIGDAKRKLLSYHGFSIMYYVNSIAKFNKMDDESILSIMKLQLRSRHLAPTHGSTQLVPLHRDFLVIDETPDIFASGHVHKAAASMYRGVVLVNASCWQYQTSYQKKYGVDPEVAKVPVVNLRDKSFQMLDFGGAKVQIFKKGIKT